jgi:pyridoxal phosphate enzyme (YggS family)
VSGTPERLEEIRAEIERAAAKSGRTVEEIELIAVSKAHNAEKIREAITGGQLLFGESKVQEARAKIPLLPSHLRWHFIGHLQKNKVRHALPLFELIHSIDSVDLAKQVERIGKEDGLFPRVLLQVNVAGEGSKFGFEPEALMATMEQLLELHRLSIEGLMTIAPLATDAEKSRPHFARLQLLRSELEQRFNLKLPHLSMGMSDDFAVAIEEGATLVRIGTRIFGPRYKQYRP